MTRSMTKVVPSLALRLVGFVTLVGAALLLFIPAAFACDHCNATFQRDVLENRADTLTGQDIMRAMENQRGLPLGGPASTALALAEGAGTAPVRAAATTTNNAPVVAAAASGTAAAPAAVAPRSRQQMREVFEGADFIDIIERDLGLSIPPTSFVPQDTQWDKEFTITLDEGKTYIGQGVMYDGFLMNGSVPGKTIVVQEGDIVKLNIVNNGVIPHGASIHAAYTQTSKYVGNVLPGETKSVVFQANTPGIYMYHCAPGGHAIPMHVLAGQYGMMVVEPKQPFKLEEELGRGPDVNIYLLQNEFYASGKDAIEGNALYTSFNGRVFRYVEEPIIAHPGDYIRINYLNVGPQNVSTFHLVGIVWDYAYWQGNPNNVFYGGQTVTSGPSDSWVIEFRAPPDEGAFLMLDHSVGNTSRGAIGVLVVDSTAERTAEVLADGPVYTEAEIAEMSEKAVRTLAPFGIGTTPVDRPVVYGPDVKEVHVQIIGNSFYPKVIEIEPGTKVTWTNEDVFTYMDGEFSGIHNAVSVNGPTQFATGLLGHAESDSVVFTESGEYNYICTPHPYMQARIIVRESAKDSSAAAKGGCTTAQAVPTLSFVLLALGMIGFVVIRRRSLRLSA